MGRIAVDSRPQGIRYPAFAHLLAAVGNEELEQLERAALRLAAAAERLVVPGEADGVLPVPPPTRSVSAWLQAVRPTSNARAKKPEIIFFIWVLLPCGVFDRCRMGATGVPPGLT